MIYSHSMVKEIILTTNNTFRNGWAPCSTLQALSGVCGCYFRSHKYSCSDRKVDLLEVFGIEVNEDVDAIHPQSYCHPCNNIIYHTVKHTRDGKDYNPQKTIATWSAHSVNCSVCLSVRTHSVGGRRPAKGSFQSAIKHIKSIAPPTICQPHRVFCTY